jgi:TetR/AcrR family transcriptional regulator, transcriptional repressor of bet genes
MPKQVDHEERRRQIADAVCRLAGRQGLEGVSLRHVAAEAGVSMGLVQHYFSTKDQMLLFTFQTLSEHVEQRIRDAVGALPQPSGPKTQLRALLKELLPLTEQARVEVPIWTAFLARAIVEPGLAAPLREGGGLMRDFIAEHIRAAQRSGDADAGVDPHQEAAALLALVDGLMFRAMIEQESAEATLATLDYHIDRIFTPVRPTDADAHPQ